MSSESADWNTAAADTHLDPLLECLLQLARIHGTPVGRETLLAGLPRPGDRLTPSLFVRAAQRAGFSARLLETPLHALRASQLPAVALLQGQRACLLLAAQSEGQMQIAWPETPDVAVSISAEELAADFTGIVLAARPLLRFDARTPQLRRPRHDHWFWNAILANWRLYRDTLLTAALVNTFALAIPLYSMNIYDRVVPNHAVDTLWVLSLGALLVLGFDFALRTVRAHIIDTAGKRVDIALSARIMERVLGMSLSARPAAVGAFASNLRAFEGVRDFIASATVTALIDLPFVVIFLISLMWISPWMILPALIGMALVIAVAFITQGKMHALTETTYRAAAQRHATLVESLVGLETLKTLCAEGSIQRRWEQATVFLAKVGARTRLLSTSTLNLAQTTQQVVNIATIMLGVYLLADKQISMGAIIAASMISGRAMAPLGQVAGLMMQFQNARTGLEAIERQMAQPVERPAEANFLHRPQIHGAIEFRDVSFNYPGSEAAALSKVSLRIAAGEKVGIIGRVGSGKTTLEKLILGLYAPSEGAVLVDGVDIRQIDPAELRRATGFVPQDVTLFFGSLRENLTLGAPLADDAAILAAAELAGVAEFAHTHPAGFDMMIGERGESLSGGQRQAVAIARALINNPPILILDEPTSAMDHQSEEQLRTRLRGYAAAKTLIVVTHRTSLLDLVDRLIVIDAGSVVADGPKAQVIEALQHGRIGRAR